MYNELGLLKDYNTKIDIGGINMNRKLSIQASQLAKAQTNLDYLQLILEKYNQLWADAPHQLIENFSEEQISFLMYGILHNQVSNGGFIQLVHNGFANYIFDSPLIASLKDWGAINLAEFLTRISNDCLMVSSKLNSSDKTLETLSNSYLMYPEFEAYDKEFYSNDGAMEIKNYIYNHLRDFILVV